jgi:hypothetical protein
VINMQMEFLGSGSSSGGCPTLYRLADGRIVVQGDALVDPEALTCARDILPGEAFVAVPAELVRYWPAVDA